MKNKVILILLLFYNLSTFSQIGGTYTYAFLNLTNSAKAASLGGTSISIHDQTLIFNNPALLDTNTTNYINFSFVSYFASVKWGFCSYSISTPKYGNFALGINYINYGKFIEADEFGNITGKFYASDYVFSLLWSYQIDSNFNIGATLKPVYSAYDTYKSFGLATDYGIIYDSRSKNTTIALVFKNLGAQIKPYVPKQFEPLPFDIQIGLTQRLVHSPFRLTILADHLNLLDLSYKTEQQTDAVINQNVKQPSKIELIADNVMRHFVFGAEILTSKNFYIALGYNYQRRQEMKINSKKGLVGFSAGLGLNIKRFSFNYSFSNYNLAGTANFFTISFKINNTLKKY